MRLAVLANPSSWYFDDLKRAAGARHELICVSFRQLAASLSATQECIGTAEIDLGAADLVLVRTMPPGSLEQVVFRMDVLARLAASGTPVVNPPRSIEAAVDKYLATIRIRSAGLLTPPTVVCQRADEAMAAFEQLGRDVVLKPLFGSEGRGITRLSDEALALRAFTMLAQMGAVIYLQQFIEHEGADVRVLVVGDRSFGMRRRNRLDWRTNVSRGAQTEPIELGPEIIEVARTAAEAVGAPLAGVDLLPGRDGRLYCLEVNAVPGWRALARTLDIDVAHIVLDYLESVAAGADGE